MSRGLFPALSIGAIGVGLGWAAYKWDLNGFVTPFLPPQLQQPSMQLAVVCVLLFMLSQYLAGNTVAARQRYGVKPPVTYPTEKELKHVDRMAFLAVVRGHENFLESNAQLMFVFFVHYIMKANFNAAFVLTLVILVARVLYAELYPISPALREIGFIPLFFATMALHGMLIIAFAQKVGLPTYL